MRSWDWGPHDGISALLRRDNRELASSFPPLCEDPVRRLPSTNQEVGPHQGTKSPDTLMLDFSTSRTVRNKLLLFKPPVLWYLVMAARDY